MDNHFPDEMTYWSERPSLPYPYKPIKQKKKIFRKEIRLRLHTLKCKETGSMHNKIVKIVSVYFLGIRLFTYKTKI